MTLTGISNYLPSFSLSSKPATPPTTPPIDIFNACQTGNLEALTNLHTNGADLNKANQHGLLPLHIACRDGHLPLVRYLVEHGSEVNRMTKNHSFSPLFLACHNSRNQVAKYLLENGALPNQSILNKTATVLHTRITPTIAKLLIEGGALLGAKDALGRIPLHNANSYDLAVVLKDAGSPTCTKDNEGRTPLNAALASKFYETASALNDSENPWNEISVQERDSKGKLAETKATYLYDNETSDLYNLEPSALKFRAKSLVVIATALPFAIKAFFTNLAKIFIQTSFTGVINRIYRAVRSPFFAIAMIFAAVTCIYDPIAGRKLMNKIEEKWDEPGLLNFANMKKVGNLAESEINGYARYYLSDWN